MSIESPNLFLLGLLLLCVSVLLKDMWTTRRSAGASRKSRQRR